MVLQKLKVETEVRALKFDDTGLFLLAGTKSLRQTANRGLLDPMHQKIIAKLVFSSEVVLEDYF